MKSSRPCRIVSYIPAGRDERKSTVRLRDFRGAEFAQPRDHSNLLKQIELADDIPDEALICFIVERTLANHWDAIWESHGLI